MTADSSSPVAKALVTVAIICLIAGYIAESSGYDVALGAFLFSVGFWIFAIPIIGIIILYGVAILVAKAKQG